MLCVSCCLLFVTVVAVAGVAFGDGIVVVPVVLGIIVTVVVGVRCLVFVVCCLQCSACCNLFVLC